MTFKGLLAAKNGFRPDSAPLNKRRKDNSDLMTSISTQLVLNLIKRNFYCKLILLF